MHCHQKLSELYKARGDGTDECVPAWVWEREKAIDKQKKLKDANLRLQCFSRDKTRFIVARNKHGKRTYVSFTKRASAKPTHVEKLDC
eukprot:1087035-Prymnesium_polylepis.1